MGLVYEARAERSKALDCYKQSLSLTRKGQDQRYEAYTLVFLGRFYEAAGDRERALYCYKQALPLNRISFDQYGESLTLYNMAHLKRDSGDLAEARARIEEALELVESLRTRVLNKGLRITYFASSYQCYELYIDILMRLHKEFPDKNFDVLAFEASERARARTLLEMLRESSTDIGQGGDAALLQRERFLRQLLEAKTERRASLKAVQSSRAEEKSLTEEIEKIAAEHQDIERRIRSTNPDYAALMQPEHLSLEEIQRSAVDEDALLLEYFLGAEESHLWAVTKETIRSFSLPGRSEIESLADRVRELLTSAQPVSGESASQRQSRLNASEEGYWREAAKLSDILLKPAAAQMEGKRLIMVADGKLQYIPFSALPDPGSPGDLSPLFLGYEITYETSATTLATLRKRARRHQPASKAVAILADPVFESDDSRLRGRAENNLTIAQDHRYSRGAYAALRDAGVLQDGDRIPRLFASRDEAETIMAMIPEGLGLKAIGFDASKEIALSSELGKYSIVHFATHGVFDNERPEFSGLMLSLYTNEGKRRDGFLQLKDIYNLDLPVDLVVLSACNTGIGKQIRGEGLLGLTRGFMYAGASQVVASLWKVDDEATAEFMKHFYRSVLREQKPPVTGLREAQIALWQQKRWRSPYFWAAFVLKGDYKGGIKIAGTPAGAWPVFILAAVAVASLFTAIYIVKRQKRRKGYGA
jgi:CHAT domain-containing protein